jgi:hypothetical protein
MKKIILSLSLLFALTAFVSAQNFGAKITDKGAISLSEMKKKMGIKKEMTTKVTAKIEDVCQKKGCWMNLVDDKGNKIRVTFKDYAFFMPKDAAGKTAIIEGVATVDETSVADLKSMLKTQEKPKMK